MAEVATGVRAYVTLMKPRVLILLQITALCAVLIHDAQIWRETGEWDFFHTGQVMVVVIVGGMLTAGGANAINMWYDRDIDPGMKRTINRPVPAGTVSPNQALWFGISISVLGVAWFMAMTNAVTAFWAGFSILFYVLIYTMWLKRTSTQNIVIGGIAGATPPLIGWAAATPVTELSITNPFFLGEPLPWLMFALIFLWTPPHFWALALYRSSEYEKVGVPMMPWVKGPERTLLEMKVYALLLIGIAAMPWLRNEAVGDEGELIWSIIAFSLGFWYFQTVLRIDPKEEFDKKGRLPTALRSFKASLYYLALMFIGLVVTALNTWAAVIFLAMLGGNLARTMAKKEDGVETTTSP
ncbi:MAG: protoheme IX farnesyltransferase [Candidatus Poseidoniales archaeon]|nr:MAG: protoheme IX farnesyltransferase [Candidatus Poseidoniales archaeon]